MKFKALLFVISLIAMPAAHAAVQLAPVDTDKSYKVDAATADAIVSAVQSLNSTAESLRRLANETVTGEDQSQTPID